MSSSKLIYNLIKSIVLNKILTLKNFSIKRFSTWNVIKLRDMPLNRIWQFKSSKVVFRLSRIYNHLVFFVFHFCIFSQSYVWWKSSNNPLITLMNYKRNARERNGRNISMEIRKDVLLCQFKIITRTVDLIVLR